MYDIEHEVNAADSLNCQEEIAPRSMINSHEIPDQIGSDNRNPCFDLPNYSSDNLRAQPKPKIQTEEAVTEPIHFSEDNVTEIKLMSPNYQPSANIPCFTEKMLKIVQNDQHERRESRIQLKEQDARNMALKYKNRICKLSLEDLMRDGDEGWIYLLKWIKEVETNSIGDRMRLHMLQVTANAKRT